MCLQMFWGRGRGYFFRSAEKPEGYGIERSENHRIHAHVQKKPHGGSGFLTQESKQYCPYMWFLLRKQTVHIVEEGIKEPPAQDLLI